MDLTSRIFRKRRRYEFIDDSAKKSNGTLSKAIFSSLFICSLMFLASYFLLWNRTIKYHIKIDQNARLLQKTSDKFLSFGIDTSLLRDMPNLPILKKKFLNLASHLSPAFVRIGGTAADCLFFDETMVRNFTSKEPESNDISNFTITQQDFISLNEFAKKANLRMIFDLNVLRRNNDNSWDDENAKKIIAFAKSNNFDLDWQLGNEPNSFFHVFDYSLSAKQLAMDYQKLRQDLDEGGYEKSVIFGPEANHIGDELHNGAKYVKEFLKNNGSIDFLTWHQYYLNGRTATVKDFINYTVFNHLSDSIRDLDKAREKHGSKIPTCMSETSTAYGGGAPELSDRFVAGFLWLDKLGYSARTGTKIVIRQSFFGNNYAMIGNDLEPNPDWWLGVAFKAFVSEKVIEIPLFKGNMRFYVHCTAEKSLINRVPAVTVFGMNLNTRGRRVLDFSNLKGLINEDMRIFFYSFTSDSLQSRNIMLNDKLLKLGPNGELPAFVPRLYQIDETIELPNLSMAFAIIHGLDLPACRK